MANARKDDELSRVFREECEESTLRLVDGLLRLEGNAFSLTDEAVGIMRTAHGLKGAAFAAGLRSTANFVHDFESCVERVRDGEAVPTPELLASLYDAVDAIVPLASAELGDTHTVDARIAVAHASLTRAFAGLVDIRLPELEQAQGTDDDVGVASSVRVPVDKLDRILETAGEMLSVRAASSERAADIATLAESFVAVQRGLAEAASLAHKLGAAGARKDVQAALVKCIEDLAAKSASSGAAATRLEDDLGTDRQITDRMLDRLQDDVRSVRLVPVRSAFASFGRLARDLAKELGKRVELVVEGGDTEVDRDLLESVREAVGHLLRNAIDHGVENPAERIARGRPAVACIRLAAATLGREARIEVSDDGRGIDVDALVRSALDKDLVTPAEAASMDVRARLELIFRAGFSTARSIGQVSGRGVGLDAVRSVATSLGGRVSVESTFGAGTRFVLHLPVSRAAAPLLTFESGRELFAVQATHVERIIRVGRDELRRVDRGLAMDFDGRPARVVHLADVVGGAADPLGDARRPALVLRSAGETVVFVVDRIVQHRQCLTKGLGDHLGALALTEGTTVLADGTVVPILATEGLVAAAACVGRDMAIEKVSATTAVRPTILVVDDSITTRTLQKGILETAGYQVVVATNGLEALDKLRRGGIALVLSDVEMPTMDGIELAGRIKADERTQTIPVVIVSSLARPEDRQRGLQAGADAYIAKGEFDQGKLLETVGRLV